MEPDTPKRMTKGGRNLMLMGVAAVVIAALTTGISMAIYHNSGDIYLDRSRPGFLPNEEELEMDEILDEDYNFSNSGKITREVLEDYLEHLEAETKAVESFENPFGAEVLSDENLGILAK